MAEEKNRLPALIAFDLDYTLWDFFIDTHVTGPLRRSGSTVRDKLSNHVDAFTIYTMMNSGAFFGRYGTRVEFYPHVPRILNQIRDKTTIAVCSRTVAPALAREALSLIRVPSLEEDDPDDVAINFFDQVEIYPGSKIAHFKQLHEKTGIPYEDMVFFDDETRNGEVKSLGVSFVLVEDGLDTETFEDGLKQWRMRYGTQ